MLRKQIFHAIFEVEQRVFRIPQAWTNKQNYAAICNVIHVRERTNLNAERTIEQNGCHTSLAFTIIINIYLILSFLGLQPYLRIKFQINQ